MINRRSILALVFFVGVSLFAGVIGSVFTASSIPTWYAGLEKPALNPPNWVFGPVWTILYILMGLAAYKVWQKSWGEKRGSHAIGVFAVQLLLNTLWSIIFFGLQNPFLAFITIILLWLAIALTIFIFLRISRLSGLLLVPYIAWVSFATYLNYSIWILNR